MKPITKFISKTGKEIEVWEPSTEKASALTNFVNRLIDEDTFLNFMVGDHKTLEQEKAWIELKIKEIKNNFGYLIWAIYDRKVIGSCDIIRSGSPRDYHVGKIGLMVDKDFRRDGVGRMLMESIIDISKKMKFKKVKLDLFSDNLPAYNLYKKLGFIEYSRLPEALFRKGKYSDEIKMYKNLTIPDPSLKRRET